MCCIIARPAAERANCLALLGQLQAEGVLSLEELSCIVSVSPCSMRVLWGAGRRENTSYVDIVLRGHLCVKKWRFTFSTNLNIHIHLIEP